MYIYAIELDGMHAAQLQAIATAKLIGLLFLAGPVFQSKVGVEG